MKELKYGSEIQGFTITNGDFLKYILPENIYVDKDTLYEIEYQLFSCDDPKNFSHICKVIHIKPVSTLLQHINNIVNKFNKIEQSDTFIEWFREHYKLIIMK